MSSFSDLPVEVLLDNLLPIMPVSDVLRLTCTNKFFAALCSDDTFWKRRLETDFNFSGAGTARISGWKFIYHGLFKPTVYVWGEKSCGRLGLSRFPKSAIHGGIPFPTRLQIPNTRIVALVAGGMSFHALDSAGRIHVWGTLDGSTYALNSDGYSESGKIADTPLTLEMPSATRSISCGRLHASSLDSDNYIWTFPSWGRPFRLPSNVFPGNSKPIQIECGWGFSSVLTSSGDVFVWWPFSGRFGEHVQRVKTEMDNQGDKRASARPDGVIPCVTWILDENPAPLPSIPSLPDLQSEDSAAGKPTQLIQIAGMDGYIIGLTNKGHVLKFGGLGSEEESSRGRWQYLPEFSDTAKVQVTFSELDLDAPWDVKITHITANFLHFTAYSTGSSSVVLVGDTDTDHESKPKVISALQYKSIISVVLGDYHNVALTSTGKVMTWGAYSAGALGLGDPTTLAPGTPGGFATEERRLAAQSLGSGVPPAVNVPTEVRFDHGRKTPKDRFCFSVAAAGWHTGALVIDLEESNSNVEDEEEVEIEPEDPPLPRRRIYPMDGPGQTPPIIPYSGIFRIGHPGRGRGSTGRFGA